MCTRQRPNRQRADLCNTRSEENDHLLDQKVGGSVGCVLQCVGIFTTLPSCKNLLILCNSYCTLFSILGRMSTAPPIDVSGISHGLLRPTDVWTICLTFISLYVIASAGQAIYDAFFGPLSKYPGPPLRALSNYPRLLALARGTESEAAAALHQKYGPVVRIGPHELSYNSGAEAWKDLHGFKKLVYKDPFFYRKPFNRTDGLITADDETHSRQRKLLSHAFADKTLKELEPMLKQWAGKMKNKLMEKAEARESVDLLKYYNCTTCECQPIKVDGYHTLADASQSTSWATSVSPKDLRCSRMANTRDGSRQSLQASRSKQSHHAVPSLPDTNKLLCRASKIRAIKYTSALSSWLIDTFIMNSETVRHKQAEHWNYSKDDI